MSNHVACLSSTCTAPDGTTALANCEELWGSGEEGSSGCAFLTEEEVDAYPNLSLELEGGFLLEMNSRDYLLKGFKFSKSFRGVSSNSWHLPTNKSEGGAIIFNAYLSYTYGPTSGCIYFFLSTNRELENRNMQAPLLPTTRSSTALA